MAGRERTPGRYFGTKQFRVKPERSGNPRTGLLPPGTRRLKGSSSPGPFRRDPKTHIQPQIDAAVPGAPHSCQLQQKNQRRVAQGLPGLRILARARLLLAREPRPAAHCRSYKPPAPRPPEGVFRQPLESAHFFLRAKQGHLRLKGAEQPAHQQDQC